MEIMPNIAVFRSSMSILWHCRILQDGMKFHVQYTIVGPSDFAVKTQLQCNLKSCTLSVQYATPQSRCKQLLSNTTSRCIRARDGSIAFLSGCIPDLSLNSLSIYHNAPAEQQCTTECSFNNIPHVSSVNN